ncbi:MAG: hypothetical protein K0S71_1007 [Clostridia bacterium]|nr:hypothetical protein [Clostridia bacterium]
MTKRDLYCFKEGKLELSILDEKIDEDIPADKDIDFPPLQEPSLIVSEEIVNTLKEMGEFLTQAGKEEVKESIQEPKIEQTAEMQHSISYTQSFNIEDYMKQETTLEQSRIDAILLSHFGELTPRFKYADELKQKIDRHIKKIKSKK